jgi:tetratricopeptide (TPR) repeat protein
VSKRVPGSSALIIVVAGLFVLLSPSSAMAQAEESGPSDEARAVFLRATELYESRSYARAEIEFRRAWELMEGHPRRALVLVNIGRCIESQPGREAEAIELYERAIAETNALAHDEGIRQARRIAEERIAELNARMAVRRQEERSEHPATPETASSSPASSASAEGGISPVGPIVLGVGGAMMLAGAITGALALVEHGDLTAMCDAQRMRCPAELEARAGDLAALSITTDVLLWGGLAVAATGAILTVLLREESGSSVSAACDETGCAAFVTGSF